MNNNLGYFEPTNGSPACFLLLNTLIACLSCPARSCNRRFTRLTNGFSKKLSHLKAAVDLYMTWYNFCRIHQTLRVTPAMEAGVTDHIWTILELLDQPK